MAWLAQSLSALLVYVLEQFRQPRRLSFFSFLDGEPSSAGRVAGGHYIQAETPLAVTLFGSVSV